MDGKHLAECSPKSNGGTSRTSRAKISLSVRVLDSGEPRTVTVHGRVAWALQNLINSPSGCTPLTHVGPRWSDYIFKLRRAGINVETIDEAHAGQFPGRHARYRLASRIEAVGGGSVLGVAA